MTVTQTSTGIRNRPEAQDEISRLVRIMERLRDPESGCPWDIEQDFRSIAPYTIEEAYEVADAIERGDVDDLKSELGDLLLQVIYHAQMAAERDHFTLGDIAEAVCDKMIRRHPHVFGTENRDKTAAEQIRDWEAMKAAEREDSGKSGVGTLSGIAPGLPALTRSLKLQNRAARVGFDWPNPEAVVDKLAEESAELVEARRALPDQSRQRIAEEYGDLLFAMVNLARHLDVDPESALRAANAKFIRRFQAVEDLLASRGRSPVESNLAEMDALWDTVKSVETTDGEHSGKL